MLIVFFKRNKDIITETFKYYFLFDINIMTQYASQFVMNTNKTHAAERLI